VAQSDFSRKAEGIYFKDGRYDEARVMLQNALSRLETDSELKALATLRLAIVEWGAARHDESLRILTESASLFEKINKSVIIINWLSSSKLSQRLEKAIT
jgi:predicted negative regulator of RcsB-dependent stress response